MKLLVQKGATSRSIYLFIRNSSLGTGAGLTGLTWNAAGLTAYYLRQGTTSPVQITLASLANVNAAFTSGGFVEVDATNMPGLYRFDVNSSAWNYAAGVDAVIIMLKGAANMEPVVVEVQLTSFDFADERIRRAFENMTIVTVASGATSVLVPTSTLTETTNDHYKGRPLYFLTGALAGQLVEITGYNGSTKALSTTVTPTLESAANGDLALIA